MHAARRYTGLGVPVQDLIEAGNLGLLHAVERFDPDVGARFATYALWWIRRAIIGALSEQGCLVQLPRGRRRVRRACRQVVEQLSTALGRRATHQEIAQATGLPVHEVRRSEAAPAVTPLTSDDGEPDALAGLRDQRAERPDKRILDREMRDRLRLCVRTLPGQEAE